MGLCVGPRRKDLHDPGTPKPPGCSASFTAKSATCSCRGERDRAAAFYEAVFGSQIEAHHPDFEAPGLIGQSVENRPPPGRQPDALDPRVGHGRNARTGHKARRRDPSNLPSLTARLAPSPRSSTRKAIPSA